MGSITPLNFREGGLQGGEPWRRAVAGGGDRGGAVVGLDGGSELGEKGEGTKGVLSPTLARAGAQQGGLPTAMGGGGAEELQQWCCRARVEVSGG